MRKIYSLVCLVFILSIFSFSVQAQNDPIVAERQKRISQRKTDFKNQLSESQKKKYYTGCNGAQTKIAQHLENSKKFAADNDKKYSDFVDKTATLIQTLKNNNQNIGSIEAVFQNISQAKTQLKSSYEQYTLALQDTAQLNCQEDPEGFRASLDAAKKYFSDLKTQRMELRKLIKKDLKTTLRSVIVNNQNSGEPTNE